MRFVKWSRKLMLSAMLVGLMTSVGFAQGGGGRGGMMGGMMGGRQGGVLSLLRMEEVQKELKLEDEQKKQLTDLGKKIADETAKFSPMAAGTNFQDMSDEERAALPKKFEEFQKKSGEITKANEKKLDDILDPMQMERLIGLLVQRESVRSVISSDKVSAAIEATEKQKEELAKIQKDSTPGFGGRGGFGGGAGGGGRGGAGGGDGTPPDFNAMREQMEKSRKEADDKMLAVLTDVQKKKLEELKGAKFEFPAPNFGGGRGGPGGAGGAGGRPAGGGRPGRTDN